MTDRGLNPSPRPPGVMGRAFLPLRDLGAKYTVMQAALASKAAMSVMPGTDWSTRRGSMFGQSLDNHVYVPITTFGRIFGAKRWYIIRKIVIPSVAPDMASGMRIGLGIAWMCIVAAVLLPAGAAPDDLFELEGKTMLLVEGGRLDEVTINGDRR